MNVTRSLCCNKPVSSYVDNVRGSLTMIYKCLGCGQPCGVVEIPATEEIYDEIRQTLSYCLHCPKCEKGKWFPTSFKHCPYCGRGMKLNMSGYVEG